MVAITGITGQVGGVVAHTLLDAGKSVRAVVRNSAKGEMWAQQGCEVALARMDDPEALRRAFAGAESVFVLLPPNFDPSPDFTETRQIVAALRNSLEKVRPGRTVCISTVGAQVRKENFAQPARHAGAKSQRSTAANHIFASGVVASIVPRDTWEALFRSQGMKNPMRESEYWMASTRVGSHRA